MTKKRQLGGTVQARLELFVGEFSKTFAKGVQENIR